MDAGPDGSERQMPNLKKWSRQRLLISVKTMNCFETDGPCYVVISLVICWMVSAKWNSISNHVESQRGICSIHLKSSSPTQEKFTTIKSIMGAIICRLHYK